jgi:hypothetical protein
MSNQSLQVFELEAFPSPLPSSIRVPGQSWSDCPMMLPVIFGCIRQKLL